MTDMKTKTITMPQAILAAGVLIAVAILGSSFLDKRQLDQDRPTQFAVSDNQVDQLALLKNVNPIEPGVDHVRGAANGQIVIYEYSDLDCPFCGRFHETMIRLVEEYPEDVSWVYRHLPLDGLHPEARPKAIATECAFQQKGDEVFWATTDVLFEQNLTLEELGTYLVENQGLDLDMYQECISSQEASERIDRDLANAIQTLGSTDQLSTPWSILQLPDGQLVPIRGAQPYETLVAVIESVINQ